MKKIQLLLALFLVTLFTACNPDDSSSGSNQNDDTFAENFGSTVSRDFIGQVVNTDNQPLQNATITIGTSTVQTDVNGVFIINGASVHTKFAYVKATKAGYLDGSRAMVPTSGKNNVKIMLIPNTPLQSVQSGVESEVSLPSGTKVKFDGAFQDENGNAYSGSVSVAMFHLTSSDANLNSLMPGMLYAQTQNNQEAILETFGMLNVELRGSAGQKLNIKEGHTAEITMKIDDSQLATAPSSMPLWHFDEQKGYWKEDGAATKIGNKYIGEVSHFSWWNLGLSGSTVVVTTRVIDSNGNPLANLRVGIVLSDGNRVYSVSGLTDGNGNISGLLPANQTLQLVIYPGYEFCTENSIIYSSTIGPFTNDTVLPDIVMNFNTSLVAVTNVIGTLGKCDNTNVTNGYVALRRGADFSILPVTNGSFSFYEVYCLTDTEFTLQGADLENFNLSDEVNFNFMTPVTNVGILQACNSVSEFIFFTMTGENGTIPQLITSSLSTNNFVSTTQGFTGQLLITGGSPSCCPFRPFISIGIDGTSQGVYNLPQAYIQVNRVVATSDFMWITSFLYYTPPTNLNVMINHYGAVGEFIDLTFTGTTPDDNGVSTLISGTAHVIRDH